jgi:uncharacterized Zn finger protein (UPF0148 family)
MDSFLFRCPKCGQLGGFDPALLTKSGEIRCAICQAASPVELMEYVNPNLGALLAAWRDGQRRPRGEKSTNRRNREWLPA